MDRGDDASCKSATGDNNSGGNFAAGVIDTDGQQWRQYQTAYVPTRSINSEVNKVKSL